MLNKDWQYIDLGGTLRIFITPCWWYSVYCVENGLNLCGIVWGQLMNCVWLSFYQHLCLEISL